MASFTTPWLHPSTCMEFGSYDSSLEGTCLPLTTLTIMELDNINLCSHSNYSNNRRGAMY